ncbi:MAG TPA: Arm DNA-binding domain-containing protein [Syntrophobacteraceae bacterium]|nr:Arm DNA-binding domain-containing protein [Syntrophobacteraceae bacterium]
MKTAKWEISGFSSTTAGTHLPDEPKLSSAVVQKAKKPGYYGGGEGLWLQISKSGGKSWVLRFTLRGKAREMGLGPLRTISLAEARAKALQHRKAVAEGRDPIQERRAGQARSRLETAKTETFAECDRTGNPE